MRLSPIDVLIVVAYMVVIAYIAWRSRKFANKSLENYFLGGRSMRGWMAGISYAASMMSADSAVGYGGMAVITGLFVCWFYLARFGLAFFIGAVLFAVYWKRLNTFTTLEFYELRFSGTPANLMRSWLAIRTSLIAMVAWPEFPL
jgi:SSS family solute:Na+ symporter